MGRSSVLDLRGLGLIPFDVAVEMEIVKEKDSSPQCVLEPNPML
jgi:hypothetical protein